MLVLKPVKTISMFIMHIMRVGKRFVQQKMIAMIAAHIPKIVDATIRLLNI